MASSDWTSARRECVPKTRKTPSSNLQADSRSRSGSEIHSVSTGLVRIFRFTPSNNWGNTMSDLLTVDELIQRIKEQNGTVIDPTDMDWILVTRRLYCRAVFASDIPKIMDSMLDARMVTNTDMKPVEILVEPLIVDCESQGNVVKECRSRADVIADYVGIAIDDLVSDSLFWKMAPGDTDVMWFEVRDAIMTKVFDTQNEMGRQELYSEQVMENQI